MYVGLTSRQDTRYGCCTSVSWYIQIFCHYSTSFELEAILMYCRSAVLSLVVLSSAAAFQTSLPGEVSKSKCQSKSAPLRKESKIFAGETSEAANQNAFGIVSDAVTGAAFSLLHSFDDCGIEDSSKNLRVL